LYSAETFHHYHGTIGNLPPTRHWRAPLHPQSSARCESHPRTAVDVHLAIPVADLATASVPDKPDRLLVCVSSFPSQLLLNELLRRPIEFTQYLSIRYSERLAAEGIDPSVGSVGDSYDNALAESVIGLFKTEVIYRKGPWKNIESLEYATLEWVDWFNNRRLLEPIGHVPPAEFEQTYYDGVEASAEVAGLN
jgi:putative transposase